MPEINPYQAPQYQSEPLESTDPNEKDGPSGLGGWLILVGIGLIVSPMALTFVVLTVYLPMFQNGFWESVTNPASPNYHPLWGPLLILELVGNIVFICFNVVLAYMFFQKSRFFPKTYIVISIIHVSFVLIDALLASVVLSMDTVMSSSAMGSIIRSVLSAAIWIPYMLVSKRVKNTFIE